ncbi:MAG: HEPN domain-containing protein [Deltaproteobacteria bacterium]|nr:HEPN domain-containing protein [Deltaproteobacteria bacterium]
MKQNHEKLAGEWMQRARSDFKYAKAGEKETGQHHITCFLCHQAAEKSLKGLLVLENIPPPKTHHLGILLGKALPFYSDLASIQKEVRKLDKFYIPARYPDDTFLEFTDEDARQALETAEKCLSICGKALL